MEKTKVTITLSVEDYRFIKATCAEFGITMKDLFTQSALEKLQQKKELSEVNNKKKEQK